MLAILFEVPVIEFQEEIHHFVVLRGGPKGPFRTKNTTTIANIVNYYAVVFLLRPPNLVRRGPFFQRKNVCNSQENGVRTRRAAIVNHPRRTKNSTRSKFTTRSIFSTAGSFGGGVQVAQHFVNKHLVNKLAFPIIYEHPVLTLYGCGKILTEGISLIF